MVICYKFSVYIHRHLCLCQDMCASAGFINSVWKAAVQPAVWRGSSGPMTWIRPTGRPVWLVGPRDPSMAEFYGLPPGKLT